MYVPPNIRKWATHVSDEVLSDTLGSMKRTIKSCKNVVMMGGFSHGELKWNLFETGNGNS